MRLRFGMMLGWMTVALLCAGRSWATEPLVQIQSGDLPIILSAPHGGSLAIPEVDVRKGEGLPKANGSGFFTGRDGGTQELALQVAQAIEQRFGKKPYYVIAGAHRKYIDFNRPAEIAYEDPDAKATYDRYHDALAEACTAVQKKFQRGLLLDIHGQGSAKDTVFRGTHDGKTVKLLRERFGEQAHHGEESLFARLKAGGWKVHPDPLDGKEQNGFRGGYIVQTYGSHERFGIDAIQLEFGADFRRDTLQRQKTADVLAAAIADYAASFLGIPTEETTDHNVIRVAIFQGAGTGNGTGREALARLLSANQKLRVYGISADEIRAGKLRDYDVVLHPGGSGSAQGKDLGPTGREQVRAFVEQGGGYVGICAGAYLATCDYDWSLGILDAKVVDRAHWARGFGNVELSVSDHGRKLFEVEPERISIYYHQGPLLAPANHPDIEDFHCLAKYETEIAKNGAPSGVMIGCTAIASSTYRKGRVICYSPHPEKTKGQEEMLLRGIFWAAKASEN
jgi:glutamine amidotransferase-like uncharacterized protein/N-formylglutamate amidohydrolase